MSCTKYETIISQLEQHGALHPDAHMFFNQALEEKPIILSVIMTQLSEIANKGKRRKGSKGLTLTQLPLKKGLN